MAKPQDTTKAEFSVLKTLWKLKQGTVAEVREKHIEQSSTEPAYTTVMTLLSRLATKGLVQVDKSRQPFVYKPLVRESSVLRERVRQFIETVFDGDADALVLNLVENETLSAEDLRRLEQTVERAEKSDVGGTP